MVADVAHDLRTPLSAMQLEVEALEAGMQTPDAAAASLHEEIEWLQRLIEDLRLLSLMDADQIQLQLAPTPLYDFLNGVCDFWQPMVTEKERALTLEAATTLPCVSLDAVRMRQVLGNLLDNAVRHTHPGGHVVIRGQVDPTAPTQIMIEVVDDGEGIAPSDLPHIFDRFYRADPARTRESDRRGNSGLGLSIAQRLVELHHGTITVESTIGQGTAFRVQLPHVISIAPALNGRGHSATMRVRVGASG
jgi:signal transduction histidine kinase